MGYAWNNVCYQDTASALAAFAKSVPSADAAGINTFTAAPTVSASGLVSWSISNRPLSATTATTRTGTTQLLACSDPAMDQYPVGSLLVVAALFFALVGGFRSGYRP